MRRWPAITALIVIALAAWQRPRLAAWLAVFMTRHADAQTADRVALARHCHGEICKRRVETAGVAYPPRELFLRAFKLEREIEAWARADGGPFKLIATWPVLAASGDAGPKRREGDRQVPEGCYRVVVFNPKSNFHLSLGLDYPNASDRIRSDPQQPGSDIYIHGGAVSIGCLALGDDAIEELYVLASDTREKPVEVHVFPARMAGPAWEKLRAAHPAHAAFWAELQPIHDAFEKTRLIPAVSVGSDGAYRLR